MSVDVNKNVDEIFSEIGEFGAFQILTLFLICIPNIISATYHINFMFASNSIEYRLVLI